MSLAIAPTRREHASTAHLPREGAAPSSPPAALEDAGARRVDTPDAPSPAPDGPGPLDRAAREVGASELSEYRRALGPADASEPARTRPAGAEAVGARGVPRAIGLAGPAASGSSSAPTSWGGGASRQRSTGISGAPRSAAVLAPVGGLAAAKPAAGTAAGGAAVKSVLPYPALAKLPTSTQTAVAARLSTHAANPAARANYLRLATDPAFAKLSPEHQRLALEALDKAPGDAKLTDDLLALAGSKDFRALDASTASDVLRRMGRPSAAERAGFVRLATSDGFKRLNRAHQAELLRVLDAKPGDAKLAADLTEAANSSDFRLLGDEAKSEVIAGLGRLKDDAAARRTLLDVAKTPGLRAMKPEDSMAILRVAGGTTPEYSGAARAELAGILADPAFAAGGDVPQTKRLARFIDEQRFLPRATTAPSGSMVPSSKPKITGPTTPPGSTDKVYGVELDGRTIQVTVKTPPPGMKHHSIDEIAAGLAATPKETRDKITAVVLMDQPHPTFPQAYAGTTSSGVVEFYPSATRAENTNFMASALIHEMGHTISARRWGDDTSDARWAGWKAAMAKDKLSPSQYGHTTPGATTTAAGGSPYADDFAESWLLYQRVKGTPREAELRRLYPERFKIMDTM